MKLTQAKIRAAKPHPSPSSARRRAKYGDGRGLWLLVDPEGNKTWAFFYTINKVSRQIGLGRLSLRDGDEGLTLDQARDKAQDYRKLVKAGIDPAPVHRERRVAPPADAPVIEQHGPTFKELAETVVAQQTATMTNKKAAAQWTSTLETYAFPTLGTKPIETVTASDVRTVLEAIWFKVPETASRLRQRILKVLDYAAEHGHLGEDALLKIRRSALALKKVTSEDDEGHAAMAADDVPGFMEKLADRPGLPARALQFLSLTATRSGQVRGATWDEIDLDKGLWVTPRARMKKRHSDHRVPLSAPALELLKALPRESTSNLVFPSPTKPGNPVSDGTLGKIMRDMGVTDAVPHGFRTSFSTWAAERTGFDSQLVEAALHHADENKVRKAYQRTDFLDKRGPLMDAWGAFVTGAGAEDNVVPIKAAQS